MNSVLDKACRLGVTAALAVAASSVWALPQSIDLSTDTGWTLRYNDVEAQVDRLGPAFSYDCLGNPAGPQCLSVTSNGYASGDWLPGAGPAGFGGQWQAFLDFTLPTGATQVQLFYELLGVDDRVEASISKGGSGFFFAVAEVGGLMPQGSVSLDGNPALPATGSTYRLSLDVVNNPLLPFELQPLPIGGGDGTAVVGRFRVDFDLPGDPNPVPEPGSLACAGLALAGVLGLRRRPRVGAVSRPCASPR